MSWNKRTPAADQQAYGAPQPVPMQPSMYSNYQSTPGTGQQQQYWQMPQVPAPGHPPAAQPPVALPPPPQPPQYNQQYSQAYQQQGYGNANQYYPQQSQQFNQNFTNQSYNHTQQGYQQHYYQHPQPTQQPNYTQNNKGGADGWEDNWDWAWDDATKKNQKPNTNPNIAAPPALPLQQHPPQLNNANVIEDSFATTDKWNWSMEDNKDTSFPQAPPHPVHEGKDPVLQHADNGVETNSLSDVTRQRSASNHSAQHAEEVRTLNDKEVVKERLPNLAIGKRFHLENLTPQWSIESQMSQESSDGPNTHSEGTYRSDNQSRNSSKGSPGPNIDNSNFNYSQSGFEEMYPQNSEWSVHSTDEPTVNSVVSNNSRQESHDELSSSMQDMSIASHEATIGSANITKNSEQDLRNVQDANHLGSLHPPPSLSPANVVPSSVGGGPSTNMPPPPPVTSAGLPAPLAPPPISSTNFPPPSSGQNPFKQSGPFSHKTNAKIVTASTSPMPTFPPPPLSNLPTPSKGLHSQAPLGFGANLETTPDNSERPDQPQLAPFRPAPVSQQVPDNLEVAPQNDRNEYLQTAHLSSADYEENTNFSGNAPPPGLRRMVVGQQETEYQNLSMSADEPPPGLSRMVPGQQTESDSAYNQPNDNYMDRHGDGQITDGGVRPYRQADGQQTPENYNQAPTNRGSDRRPIGLDRMVPGESSNNEYMQYQNSSFVSSNAERVVTGGDHEFTMTREVGPSDVREQNMDGSDFLDQTARNPPRNIMSSRDVPELQDFGVAPDVEQREVIMEGENLQDLSNISSTELTYSREQIVDGADVTLGGEAGRRSAASDAPEPAPARRTSYSRANTSADDSDRDRAFKSSPRRDRDKRKTSRDHERDTDGRYSRGDRKYDREREERRSVREDKRPEKERRDRDKKRERRDREESPDAYKQRRSTRSHRYETEDTDYYSDRERERRRYREGSYTSKPPRPEDRDKRHDRERNRRYNTIERDRGYEEERDGRRERHKSSRHEARYRNIDPTRKYGNLHLEREAEHRRAGESPSRTGSREDARTDDELNESRRRGESHRRSRHNRPHDPYYDTYAASGVFSRDAYTAQRQYEYYEQLRRRDPAAYMRVYKQLMQGHAPALQDYYAQGYGAGYECRTDERGSVHSGRSSTNGLKTDTDLNTDASLNLQLEESTVRSERMTPFKYSTAHVKASISSRDMVLVRARWPVDAPAAVSVVALHDVLRACAPPACPTPLRIGITHKKSVLEYVMRRLQSPPAAPSPPGDPAGSALLWEFLAALLTQNGVVVGSDLAELLMKNQKQFPYAPPPPKISSRNVSRRESSTSREEEDRVSPPVQPHSISELTPATESVVDEQAALDKLREYLTYGNRHEALEWAMRTGLWAHALQLAGSCDRRVRSGVAARFVTSLRPHDPLRTVYAALGATQPPAATGVSDPSWGDWRAHAAVLLANTSARPDQDRRSLLLMGDSLMSRGLHYSAQFCYVTAGEPFSRHPLAPLSDPVASPPRLFLLMAEPRPANLQQLATDTAILATEIYEYAMSLHQPDFVIPELQVYKLIMASRLCDVGLWSRALGYTEACAAAAARAPHLYHHSFVRSVNALHNRLVYFDSELQESLQEEDSAEPSPRHVPDAHAHVSAHSTPQHVTSHNSHEPQLYTQPQWDQNQQYQQPIPTIPAVPTIPTYPTDPEDNPDYSQYYQQNPTPAQPISTPPQPIPTQESQEDQSAQYSQWGRAEDNSQGYGDPYWQQDSSYGYGDYGASETAPQISLPGSARAGSARAQPAYPDYDDDRPSSADHSTREPDPSTTQKASSKEAADKESRGKAGGGGGWLGGILTKLSLRPPNQMILPDDKNPSIVWDAENKRWRNLDGDEDVAAPPPPPPTAPQINRSVPAPGGPPVPPAGPGAPPVSNIFKMQKGRHIKKSYVDVLNPGGGAAPPPPPPNYFTPAPEHNQSGIYDPTQIPSTDDLYNSGI